MLELKALAELTERIGPALDATVRSFQFEEQTFPGHPNIQMMGVVNLSPDSWYRESVCLSPDAAIERGLRLIQDGAALVDLGAESTVLDADRVSLASQKEKLLPVVKALAEEGVLVSVESYHPELSEAAFAAGARVLNLTSALDTTVFYEQVASHDAGVIICYIQGGGNVRDADDFEMSDDHTGVLQEYFAREIEKAMAAGVSRLWIDPGLGFYYRNLQDSARRVDYQMKTFLESARLRALGWPVCQALPHAFEYFEEDVRSAEPFFAVLAALGKTDLIRTHEVARVRGVLKTLNQYS